MELLRYWGMKVRDTKRGHSAVPLHRPHPGCSSTMCSKSCLAPLSARETSLTNRTCQERGPYLSHAIQFPARRKANNGVLCFDAFFFCFD